MATLPTQNFDFQNFFSTTLTADITSGALTIAMAAVPTPTEGILVIDPDSATNREIVFYTGKTVSTVTLPSDGRGWDGTSAVSHLNGTTVIMAPVGYMLRLMKTSGIITDATINTSKLMTASNFLFDFVASGCVITGTGYGTTLNWSMTSGVVYIGGKQLTVAAATGTVTASKDTYFDLLDPGTGTVATLVNTSGNIVANNAASPALAASSVRIGIVVSGAGSIAAATSINQGQETMVLPIASSVPYAVTDSLGNLICPRDPNRKILGYRQITASAAQSALTASQIIGLTCPVIVPTGRKIKISAYTSGLYNGTALDGANLTIWDGTVGSGTQLQLASSVTASGSIAYSVPASPSVITTPATASKTYNLGLAAIYGGIANFAASAIQPGFIIVELA